MLKFAEIFTKYLILTQIVNEDSIIYKHGFSVLFNELVTAFLVFLISIFINELFVSLIYLLLFGYLREYIGGYHAKSYTSCRILYITLYLLNIIFINMIDYPFLLLISFVCIILTIKIAPVCNPNQPISDSEIPYYKKKGLIRLIQIIILFPITYIWDIKITKILCTLIITITILAVFQHCIVKED